MRWVLIRPWNYSVYYDPEIQEPLGLEYLSSFLIEMGDSVLILDCSLNELNEIQAARRAISFLPQVIGFSLTTAQELKSVNKIYVEFGRLCDSDTVAWIAGGNFVSTETEHAKKLLPQSMHLVRFEGETAVSHLRELFLQKKEDTQQHNLRISVPRQVISGGPVFNLDSLPFPIRPFARKIIANGGALNIHSSRGCCGNCVFCASPGMAKTGRNRWRGRSIKRIVDEIEMLQNKYDAHSFNFVDEDFLGTNKQSQARGIEFADNILSRGLNITFSIQVRPDSLTLETIDALAKAGLSFVFMGLETDSADFLRQWNRPIVNNPWQFVQRFREKAIEVNVGAMLFHKEATFQSIRTLSQKLNQHELLDYRSATNKQVAMPGSYLYTKAVKDREINMDTPGPQPIACKDSRIESLHADLIVALAPLGPPSMEALCALPRIVAQKLLHGGSQKQYENIKHINHMLRVPVLNTLCALIDHHELKSGDKGLVKNLRKKNLQIAIEAVSQLSQQIGRVSFEELREAIRIDAGV